MMAASENSSWKEREQRHDGQHCSINDPSPCFITYSVWLVKVAVAVAAAAAVAVAQAAVTADADCSLWVGTRNGSDGSSELCPFGEDRPNDRQGEFRVIDEDQKKGFSLRVPVCRFASSFENSSLDVFFAFGARTF